MATVFWEDLLQDPFLFSVHIIANPSEAETFQNAADRLLSLIHPQLTLFRVSKRAERLQQSTKWSVKLNQPLSVILFLREERHKQQLSHPPWHYHHTVQVKGSSVSHSAMQDFYTLAPGTPLWALQKVHHGKEIIRFTLYCRYETYSDQVCLYRRLLSHPLAKINQHCSFCVVYCNNHMEIQLAFKRSPQGQKLKPAECTLIEIRIRNIDGLIPLLPYSCRQISDKRWQSKDHDGNMILLQVQASTKQSMKSVCSSPHVGIFSFASPYDYVFDVNHKYGCQNTNCFRIQNLLKHSSRPMQCPQEIACAGWVDSHSHSFRSLTTEGLQSRCSFFLTKPRFRINVDTLVGAEETDIDTGQTVISRFIDLSVVSAYMLPQTENNSQAQVLQSPSEHKPFYNLTSALK